MRAVRLKVTRSKFFI